MVVKTLLYPFTRGAVVLLVATLAGLLPVGGVVTLLVATTFALPVVRASARGGPDADRMPRLVPPPPGLGRELVTGALLQLLYFAPLLLSIALALLAEDVPELGFLRGVMMLPLLLQVVLLLGWPAAVALLAAGEHPFTVATRRVVRRAEEMGAGYGVVLAWVIVAGGAILCGLGPLAELGLAGELAESAIVAWFWLVALHLVGRALRGQPPFAATAASAAGAPSGGAAADR